MRLFYVYGKTPVLKKTNWGYEESPLCMMHAETAQQCIEMAATQHPGEGPFRAHEFWSRELGCSLQDTYEVCQNDVVVKQNACGFLINVLIDGNYLLFCYAPTPDAAWKIWKTHKISKVDGIEDEGGTAFMRPVWKPILAEEFVR